MMLTEQEFIDQYSILLIKQYWEKPKAKAEIELYARSWYKCYKLLYQFNQQFDLDSAFGRQLDTIGKIVDFPRLVPDLLPKVFFGFDSNTNAAGFADKFNGTRPTAPLRDKFGQSFTGFELGDADYKFFIRAKILKNASSPFISHPELVSIQDVTLQVFEGQALAIDNKDMTIFIVYGGTIASDRINLLMKLDLIPTPTGVGIEYVTPVYFSAFRWFNTMNYTVPERMQADPVETIEDIESAANDWLYMMDISIPTRLN